MRPTPEQCELLALKLARIGGFVEMNYRLFPETRNSFSPNLLELGFDFQEMRLLNATTELRFQILPPALVHPLKRRLEDLRGQLRAVDEGPLAYTGAPFLSHENIQRFLQIIDETRTDIKAEIKREVVDNYESVRQRAFEELQKALQTLLPRLGIGNSGELLSRDDWFREIFPRQEELTGDFRLDVHIYNVHPLALLESPELHKQVQHHVDRPRQMSLFR